MWGATVLPLFQEEKKPRPVVGRSRSPLFQEEQTPAPLRGAKVLPSSKKGKNHPPATGRESSQSPFAPAGEKQPEGAALFQKN